MKIDQDLISDYLNIFLKNLKGYCLDVWENIIILSKVLLGFAVAILFSVIWIKLAILANKSDNNLLYAFAIGFPLIFFIFILPLISRIFK